MEQKVFLSCHHTFVASNPNQLSFKKGDKLILENNIVDNNWWVAINPTTNQRGYIPSNYVAIIQDSDTPNQEKPITRNKAPSIMSKSNELPKPPIRPTSLNLTKKIPPKESTKSKSVLLKDMPPIKKPLKKIPEAVKKFKN